VSLDANVPDEPFCALDELASEFGLPESELPLGEPWVREPPGFHFTTRNRMTERASPPVHFGSRYFVFAALSHSCHG